MSQRVFLYEEMEPVVKSKMRGGEGNMLNRVVIDYGKPLAKTSPFIGSGINALEPGASIGVHQHVEDEELYVIISGEGDYIDNDGKRHAMKPGDIAFCLKGESHGLVNTGSDLLVFGAAIAK